ncbi:MAG: ferric iron uptake transcriptional regulator [Gammaproteobacteria bacterium]|nr:ferric iron uptake transcriptional regulator [Gammaproteobacteria bacterium]
MVPTRSELKKAGLKTTVPRLKILGILEETSIRHMTAEDVYKELLDAGEDIGLATVYRVLTQFETAGLVIRHNFEGGRSVFELDDEGHHDHIVCVECGRVFEFYDKTIEERQRKVAENAGFVLQDHSLHMYGVCHGMKKNGKCSIKKNEGVLGG